MHYYQLLTMPSRRRSNTPPPHPRRRKRASHLFSATALLLLPLTTSTTTNFCGIDWNDASTDCLNRQPCPEGTDEECDSGICWADTTCDTAKGDGLAFNEDDPSHQRFCGSGWNDAAENCSAERHCPGGDSSECQSGESCYSFLSGCNFLNMTGGGGGGGGGEGGNATEQLDHDNPTRSNWCGSDWNDAVANCDSDDHWCPSGSDADCPDGKICFAGTECKYIADLHPTISPTPAPSISPTTSPVIYNSVENTRFCGTGWEDTETNCQISTHCPSGENTECPSGQSCYGWISGCNILDMRQYLKDHGKEIYGSDRIEMDPVVVEGADSNTTIDGNATMIGSNTTVICGNTTEFYGNTTSATTAIDTNTTVVETDTTTTIDTNTTTVDSVTVESSGSNSSTIDASPEATPLIDSNAPSPSVTPPPLWSASPVEGGTTSPTVDPANVFHPEHHIFCGSSWSDAQAKCSEETFCSTGANHLCTNETDFCWVGVTACDAVDWISSAPSVALTVPTPPPSTTLDMDTSPAPSIPSDFQTDPDESIDRYSIRQSYCAESYLHLIDECATLETCNDSKCPDGFDCYKSVVCSLPEDNELDIIMLETSMSIFMPETSISTEILETSPLSTIAPSPASSQPTTSSDNSPSPSEVLQVLSTDSPSLSTQNTVTISPEGEGQTPNPSILTQSLSLSPQSEVSSPPQTGSPSQNPIIFTITPEEVEQRMSNPNNYCAAYAEETLSNCSYSLKTCNDGDPMCPMGTSCFENIFCPRPTTAPVSQAPNLPEQNSTPHANSSLIDDIAIVAQSYCSTSEDMIQSTCQNATTCNDGAPCPSGFYCFANVICEAAQSLETNVTTSPQATTQPSQFPTVSDSAIKEAAGHFCAESEAAVQSTCATAITCSDEFGTCPLGLYCFTDVVCKALEFDSLQDLSAQPSSQITGPPADTSGCLGLCITPVDSIDCEYVLSVSTTILPCSSLPGSNGIMVGIDEICAGTGNCGTSLDLNNCDTQQDLYLRIDPIKCIEFGIGDSGVVLPDADLLIVSTPANVEAQETIESLAFKTYSTGAPIIADSMELKETPSAPLADAWIDPMNDKTNENKEEINSWWIKEESGASNIMHSIFVRTSLALLGAQFLL